MILMVIGCAALLFTLVPIIMVGHPDLSGFRIVDVAAAMATVGHYSFIDFIRMYFSDNYDLRGHDWRAIYAIIFICKAITCIILGIIALSISNKNTLKTHAEAPHQHEV